ncbi:hypothetical protein [Bacillus sp. ISL-37]|uniref:hypothetical protein n=1 Tax=Bacillus sp. ISL-37 TaxID=2819123 RepID=UPI001BE6AB49|nr:hypothetical protein [Bacillus sp. ISL-37]MBT2684533.1 hypothetical protein [Bacillus sp. ISL-37]
MKRKLLIYGTAALLLLSMLIAMDRYKLYKEEKPPLPVVTIEGEEIAVFTGGYNWHGTRQTTEEPIKLMAGTIPSKAMERQKLTVTFPADKKPKQISITQVNSVPGGEKLSAQSDTILIPKSQTVQNILFQITAGWDEEFNSFSTYFVNLAIEDLPNYYDFLSKDTEKLSVLAIVPRGDSEKYDIPDEVKAKLDSFQISDDINGLKERYPELTTNVTPVYMIFTNTHLAISVLDKEALFSIIMDDGLD